MEGRGTLLHRRTCDQEGEGRGSALTRQNRARVAFSENRDNFTHHFEGNRL